MPAITAIETEYAGCRFRSRIEARWAVFFDHLQITWRYESEGFVLEDGTCYLPDFYLPEQELWVEIKGAAKWTDPDISTWEQFANERLHVDRAGLFVGDIPDPRRVTPMGPPEIEPPSGFLADGIHVYSDPYAWCICPACKRPSIEFSGRGSRICGPGRTAGCGIDIPETYTGDNPQILAAYTAARSARFEHGEQGASWR
jgi:hypothetical protein